MTEGTGSRHIISNMVYGITCIDSADIPHQDMEGIKEGKRQS